MSDSTRGQKIRGECRHFRGIRKSTCAAGVRYADVWAEPEPGTPRALPCLAIIGYCERVDTCEKYDPLTPEEAEERDRANLKAAEEFVAKLRANICPICDRAIEARVKVGRCVYAKPCGHRLGQAMRRTK